MAPKLTLRSSSFVGLPHEIKGLNTSRNIVTSLSSSIDHTMQSQSSKH